MESKSPLRGPSRFKRFISGKGFYVALAVCLLAIGGIAAATFGQTLFVRETPKEPSTSSGNQPVGQVVNDQPDERKTTTTSTAAPTTTTTAAPKAADLYVLPMGNLVQQAYSGTAPAYSVTMGDWRVHEGADFAGERDQPIKALADGTVKAVIADDPMWGGVVEIDHGIGVVSRYCGIAASVKPGETVKVGSAIGKLAEIPCESAQTPHLHLELMIDDTLVNPVEAIGREVRYQQESIPEE